MKIGKVSQTVLKRSVLKPLQFQREETLWNPTVEEMCYGIRLKEGEQMLSSESVLYGNEKDLGVFALAQVVNDLASRGAKAVGASVHISLPPYAYESRLKAMMEHVEAAASEHGVQIISAKAEVSPVLQSAMIHVNGFGKSKDIDFIRSNMAKPGQDIVLLKWIGLCGMLRVMREKEEALRTRFVPGFLAQAESLYAQLFSEGEIAFAKEFGVSAMHQIGAGGILAALWELCESADIGMEVDLKKMSIRQETVEICEYFHLNPYQITSTGSVLIVTDKGEELVESYLEKGVQATILGHTTKEKARVILGGEEKRFLDRPAPDELVKIYDL